MKRYVVYYTNPGKSVNKNQRTHAFNTLEDAKESAEFLKWQGAKKVRIIEEK